jgi:hypothetical protein
VLPELVLQPTHLNHLTLELMSLLRVTFLRTARLVKLLHFLSVGHGRVFQIENAFISPNAYPIGLFLCLQQQRNLLLLQQ